MFEYVEVICTITQSGCHLKKSNDLFKMTDVPIYMLYLANNYTQSFNCNITGSKCCFLLKYKLVKTTIKLVFMVRPELSTTLLSR